MKIFEIKDQDKYNGFVATQKHSQFLQSWEWGEFQKSTGSVVKRFGVENNGELIFVFTLIKKSLGFGKNYFYCPRIPVTHSTQPTAEFIFKEIKKIAKQENVIFFRFEPIDEPSVTGYGLRVMRTIDVQPSKTIILDLEKSEEELLASMHQKTRYNIRLAEKKGVKIIAAGVERFEDFWKLMEQTVDRDGFRLHGKEYYKKMLAGNFVKLYLAEYQDRIIAGNIIAFFGDTATYVHGASSNEDRNVMAPYLLQWEVIKEAQRMGMKYYDFYGIDEKKWPGVTRFKTGFGGREITYPGTFDLVFDNFWYNVYKAVRKLRRLI